MPLTEIHGEISPVTIVFLVLRLARALTFLGWCPSLYSDFKSTLTVGRYLKEILLKYQ
jgi:hypothetical protein